MSQVVSSCDRQYKSGYEVCIVCTFVCRTRKILKRCSGDTKFEFPAVTPSGIGKIEGIKTCLFVTDK